MANDDQAEVEALGAELESISKDLEGANVLLSIISTLVELAHVHRQTVVAIAAGQVGDSDLMAGALKEASDIITKITPDLRNMSDYHGEQMKVIEEKFISISERIDDKRS